MSGAGDYHGRVMNIQGDPVCAASPEYQRGHRDARHAAASIAVEADVEIAALRAELAVARDGHRMCVMCGKTVPADLVKFGDSLPECTDEDGYSGCTFDLTAAEAWQHWRDRWYADREAWKAQLAKARTVTPEMVERALDEINPYWREYGASLRETECDEMRAALEAAMGGDDGR